MLGFLFSGGKAQVLFSTPALLKKENVSSPDEVITSTIERDCESPPFSPEVLAILRHSAPSIFLRSPLFLLRLQRRGNTPSPPVSLGGRIRLLCAPGACISLGLFGISSTLCTGLRGEGISPRAEANRRLIARFREFRRTPLIFGPRTSFLLQLSRRDLFRRINF